MKMSEMKNSPQNSKQQLTGFGGINYSPRYKAGDLTDSKNLSADEYPWISQRKSQEQFGSTIYSDPLAICNARDKLCVVDYKDAEGKFYYDGVLADGNTMYSLPSVTVTLVAASNYATSQSYFIETLVPNPVAGDKYLRLDHGQIHTYDGSAWSGGVALEKDILYVCGSRQFMLAKLSTTSYTYEDVVVTYCGYRMVELFYLLTVGDTAPASAVGGDKFCYYKSSDLTNIQIYTYNGSTSTWGNDVFRPSVSTKMY